MIAVAVDDEPLMLYALAKAVKASPDITSVTEFSSGDDTLRWVQDNPVDVAFLDIDMRGMDGLTLAERIIALHPDCRIVFCTGYEQYAVAAIKLRVSGYLMKPITAKEVQEELDYIKGRKAMEKPLTVKCFGNFEVYARGEKLAFRRTKTKELFAFLVDRNGAGVTGREICARLWMDSNDEEKQHNYLRQLILDLRQSLESVGAGSVLEQSNYTYLLNTEKLDCDFYTYLKTGKPEFRGEYMEQYGWAEGTRGLLWRDIQIR